MSPSATNLFRKICSIISTYGIKTRQVGRTGTSGQECRHAAIYAAIGGFAGCIAL